MDIVVAITYVLSAHFEKVRVSVMKCAGGNQGLLADL